MLYCLLFYIFIFSKKSFYIYIINIIIYYFRKLLNINKKTIENNINVEIKIIYNKNKKRDRKECLDAVGLPIDLLYDYDSDDDMSETNVFIIRKINLSKKNRVK